MNSFPAKRKAFRTLILTVSAAVVFYGVGFPMPLALALGYLLNAILFYVTTLQ